MELKLSKELCERIGTQKLKTYGVDGSDLSWRHHSTITLALYGDAELATLRELIVSALQSGQGKIRGGSVTLRDLDTWTAAVQGKTVKARSVQQFHALLTEYLRAVPGHRIVYRDEARGVTLHYYVNQTQYHPPETRRDYTSPAMASLSLLWREFGQYQHQKVFFYPTECQGMSVPEALMRKGYTAETVEDRKRYLVEMETFVATVPLIGTQYWATGVATDDVDGNKKEKDTWWRSSTKMLQLESAEGQASRCVVDVFYEQEDDEDSDRDEKRSALMFSREFEKYFWSRLQKQKKERNKKGKATRSTEDDDEFEDALEDTEDDDVIFVNADLAQAKEENAEIPTHPLLAVFDIRRHLRLRIHIAQLTAYEYDSTLGGKLILPEEERDLIDVLLNHRVAYKDVITNKGTGAVVLCGGPPGTGKTLTAEVYAEVAHRPLYSVQCSQLGVAADVLEEELLKTFARAKRWNAILLLDEADVYVAQRGSDLTQNAIVGVFLRTLEYYQGVMFLTTNRTDLVDDAVASRCVAKINYTIPDAERLKKIWGVLAATTDIAFTQKQIEALVKQHPELSGRDVKNLLKLALMVAEAKKQRVTPELIAFVKRFKPTENAKYITNQAD